jgi:glucose/arabinose dehydrogenase
MSSREAMGPKARRLMILIILIVAIPVSLLPLLDHYVRATKTDADFNTDGAKEDSERSVMMMNQDYLCTDYGDIVHCDPSLSKLRSFEVSGNWSEIYRPSGTATYVDGKYGKALLLEGTTDRESVEINNTQSINPMNFSVSFWVKTIPEQETTGAIISHSNADRDAGWDFIILENGTTTFEVKESTGEVVAAVSNGEERINYENINNSISSNNAYNTGIRNKSSSNGFTHIVGTFDGTEVSIYTNGYLDERHAYNGSYTSDPKSPLKVGSISSSAGDLLWTGIIDDLALYNRTLDKEEIRAIYNSPNSYHFSQVNGLISHWSFDETLNDTAGANFGNNGLLRTLIASMAFTPDGRLFFSEKNTGYIRIMDDDKVLDKPFVTIPDAHIDIEQGLLGLAVDPFFGKNHYIYLYYTADKNGNGIVNRLVRFTDSNNTAVNQTILLDNIPASPGFHSGGAVSFGPDDKIYLGVGDATIPEFVQNPSILLGKVLRLDRDGKIPEDNPFPHSPVYTLGHRNLYGIAFDPKSGLGLIAENGDDLYDEINIISKGGNYGFPTMQPPNMAPETDDSNSSILPIRSYWRTPAPTQTIYYEWDKYPDLNNQFLVGTFDGDIYALKFDSENRTIVEEQWIDLDIYPYSAVIAIAASPLTEDIYFAGNAIYKLTSIDSSTRKQTVFPVSFGFETEKNRVNNVEFSRGEEISKMTAEIETSNFDGAEQADSGLTLRIEIPKALLPNIYNVTMTFDNGIKSTTKLLQQSVETGINNPANPLNSLVDLEYMPSSRFHVEIFGSSSSDME